MCSMCAGVSVTAPSCACAHVHACFARVDASPCLCMTGAEVLLTVLEARLVLPVLAVQLGSPHMRLHAAVARSFSGDDQPWPANRHSSHLWHRCGAGGACAGPVRRGGDLALAQPARPGVKGCPTRWQLKGGRLARRLRRLHRRGPALLRHAMWRSGGCVPNATCPPSV